MAWDSYLTFKSKVSPEVDQNDIVWFLSHDLKKKICIYVSNLL